MNIEELLANELQLLGITKRYRGFRQVMSCVMLALDDEDRLLDITKTIYWEIADRFGCDTTCVERNIRTVARVAWNVNPTRLQELARYPLSGTPTASEFVTILFSYIQRTLTGAA